MKESVIGALGASGTREGGTKTRRTMEHNYTQTHTPTTVLHRNSTALHTCTLYM